jgi:hypothetical protein
MQLSISHPTPTAPDPTPASSSLAGLIGDTTPQDGGSPDAFSQFLPPPKPDNSGQDTQSKSDKPTKAQEEAAAAMSASMLATVQQHLSPTLPPGLVAPVVGKGIDAIAGKAEGGTTAETPTGGPALALAALTTKAPAAAQAAPKAVPLSPPNAAIAPAVPVAATSAAPVPAPALPGPAASPLNAQTMQAAAMGGEKIAAAPLKSAVPSVAPTQAAAKKFLSNGGKQVTDSSDPLGTPVAKVTPAMPMLTNPERTSTAQPAFQVASVAAASTGAPSPQAPAQADVTGTAKGAVEAAMTAAEMLTTGAAQNSMNMQFAVGDAELNLRVEMKNGEVQATFSTNSAQLRSDLAHEWQTTAAGNSQSSLHQIQPIFTSSGTGSTLSSGEYAQQQGRGQNPSAEPRFSTSGGSSSSSSSYAPTHDEDDAQAAPAAAAAGSLHLQTFA